MAAAIASAARTTAASSMALCWANMWILVSSLPLGLSETPVSGVGECNRTLFLHVSVHGVAVAQGAKAGSAWRWSAAPACLYCHVAEARLLDSCLV